MAQANATKLGSSLPVPSVQELAKELLTQVPLKYVRPDLEPPLLSNTAALLQVPVVDMQKLLSEDSVDLELNKLDRACKEWGFFQVINHGAKKSLVDKMKIELRELFNLPMEEKKKLWQEPGQMEGFGQHFVVSEDQKLDWADLFYLITLPIHMRKTHVFSALPPSFRETVEAYSAELRILAMRILEQMAKALGINFHEIEENYEAGWQSMRMNYYPPCPQPDHVIGLNPHSDAGGLTILLQVNEIEGLQIRKDGNWIPVKPLPDAFVINIGDSLEIMTNGIYPSIEHRATVNPIKERISIATFYSPRFDGTIGPAPSVISPETPARFRTMTAADFYKGYFARELRGKSYLEEVRVQDKEQTNGNDL
ncbi:Flavonol synthase/flavanone 3-hydroxylase, putative [Ricinus communis]|uniref:Flavonol synthase/flavanone 3-hydroxylase, putative n=1 Tax=Ricinus communis TaxID=3988 RepID=B9S197_RICCO|nr:Flavonol synthase/flavanone 3-hydroxylase, putative [Ricinus communis]|eukprot:XP_002519766.1 protein SRG1 [Ricinus communis]